MKFSQKTVISLLLFCTISYDQTAFGHYTTNPNVQEISTIDAFHTAVTSNKPVVLMAYMQNCAHCASLLKHFETAADKNFNKIDFIKVNGPKIEFHNLVKQYSNGKFQIPGYPSIIFIKNGTIQNLQIGGNPKSLTANITALLAS